MSQSVIAALRVNLGLDSAQFEKGAKRSQNTLATMRKRFLVVAGAAAAMGAALSTAALKGAADIDKAAKAARRIDSSIGGFRALSMAAGEAGVSVESLADAVQTMDREIAKGSKSAGEALKQLGLNAKSLEGLDADQKIAKIADAIQDMGLSTAQASVVLQQLGVRNKEMVLAVMNGGDVFRDARRDVEDYGLAISKVDSDAIEKANDQLGRLGLISQYAGQQLAIALVPAMGRLAQVMTDSLREGGLLRGVIDGLVNNLDVLAFTVGTVVAITGGRLVAALAASTLALGKKALAAGVAASAMRALGVAVAFAGGPLGAVAALLGTAAAAAVVFGRDTDTTAGAMSSAEEAAALLGTELGILSGNDLPIATAKTVDLANANLTLARSALEAAKAQVALSQANLQAGFDQMSMENAFLPGTDNPGIKIYTERMKAARDAAAEFNKAQAELNARVLEGEKVKNDASKVVRDLNVNVRGLEGAAKGAGRGLKGAKEEAEKLSDQMDGPLPTAIDGVSQALGDWFSRGFKDVKKFTDSVLDSFKGMISQMIATAVANPIRIALGVGGSVAGTAAQAGTGLLGSLGGAGGLLGGGGLAAVGSGLSGVLGGGGLSASFANLGGLLSGSVSGLGAIGAALPALGVIAAPLVLLAAFKKKKTLLDSGLDVDVDGSSVDAQLFQTVNTKRFFGLSSKTRTSNSAADPAIAQAIGDTQAAVRQMAAQLDIGAEAFAGFSYSFQLSLKDMNAEQAAQAVAGEIGKMGDAFAGLIPHIANVNELIGVLQERFGLETRLLQLQGNVVELRRRELDSVSHYNRAILQQIFDLEDAQVAARLASEAMAEANRRIEAFAGNVNNFATRADQQFAATSVGYRRSSVEMLAPELLRELIQKMEEGNINQARLTTRLVQIEERRMLEANL